MKKCIVVCGPTASGKSALSDEISGGLSTAAILIDSMQVYKEIPCITNQSRSRPARLSGIISVTSEWSVADHAKAARREISDLSKGETDEKGEKPFVLDAGTGMYLNATILDISLAPSVSPEIRKEARELTKGAANPRRAARSKELELSGEGTRGSIWDGDLLHDTTLLYIRPDRETLDREIEKRSRKIVSSGMKEAEVLRGMISDGSSISASVLDSIGVKELLSCLSGEIDMKQAEEMINTRTRRLARRQIRWFDKLAGTLEGRAEINVLEKHHQYHA